MSQQLQWKGEHLFRGEERVFPKIFDSFSIEGEVPGEFNTVKIVLDARVEADLNWEPAKKQAREAVEKGFFLFWEVQMGLFSELPQPMTFETQARTLQLSLHAFEKDVWEEFADQSIGLCVYRGGADFTMGFPWLKGEDHHDNLRGWLKDNFHDEALFISETGVLCESFDALNYRHLLQTEESRHLLNLFCRNVCCDYLDLLTEKVSDAVPLFILIDASLMKKGGELAQILSRERFSRYHLAVRKGPIPLQGMAWDDERAAVGFISHRPLKLKDEELSATALCLPPVEFCRPSQFTGFEEALKLMSNRLIHYRIIPEPYLITEWHGLDYIIVLSSAVTDEGVRMLQGFCAAGGTVVTIGTRLGLPKEEAFHEWTNKLLEIL